MITKNSLPTSRILNVFLKRKKREIIIGYLFILPSFACILIFLIGPIIYGFVMSFHRWFLGRPPVYAGFTNYLTLLSDPLFWLSMRHTLEFSMIYVPSTVFLPLIVAIILHSKLLGRRKEFFKFVYFIPVVASLVVVAIMWKYLYHGDYGLINYFLEILGFEKVNWLGDKKMVIPAIALVSVWKNYAYYMVIFLAGLAGISEQYYEAARIDGASRMQQFLHVTFPLLARTFALVLVLSTILAFQVFEWIYVMSRAGGPAHAGYTVGYLVYVTGLVEFRMGYGSSIAVVLFLIILLVSLLEIRLGEGKR